VKPFIPRPWQVPAIDHLLEHRRAALWKPMGSGKTVDVLTALDTSSLAGHDPYPALAIGPLRVARKVWREEAGKWTHTVGQSVSQIIGDADTRGFIVDRLCSPGNNALHEVYTINWENVPWLVDKLAGRMPFRSIVPDEARKLGAFRIKQGGAQAGKLGEIAWHKNVVNFWELTGTPAPNGSLKDLWGQLWFLDKGQRLGLTFSAFEEKYFAYKRVQDALSHKQSVQTVVQPGSNEDIMKRVKDICLSIDLKDYIKLDEPFYVRVPVSLPPPARVLYNEMERRLFIEIEGHQIEAFNAATKSQKLMQLANGAAYLDPTVESDDEPGARAWKETHVAKLEALDSIVDETGGVPLLVVYNFKSDLARLKKAYPDGRHLHSEKDEDDFKAGGVPMLFLHPKSGGHGIDGFERVCNVIVFFGEGWDMELRDQVIARIGPTRQMQSGMNKPVFVYDIVADDTIDDVILQRHVSKRGVQDLLLEAVKARKDHRALGG
jgi:SNF2 family DNA or RNA helicase